MAFVQFTQPDDQPIVINTDRIVTATPLPDGQGTRITLNNGGYQDVMQLIADVLRQLNIPNEVEAWMTAHADEALRLQRPLADGALRIVARCVKEDPAGPMA